MAQEIKYELPLAWPDLSALDFKILCPGPSLARYQFSPALSDCFIAVNGAILQPGIDFMFWALGDAELFKTCTDKMEHPNYRTILWTHEKFGRASHEQLAGWNYVTRSVYTQFSIIKYFDLSAAVRLGPDLLWSHYTMFSAIALGVLCHAKQIDVYGADLSGKGYFRDDLANQQTKHDRERWIREARMFDDAVKACEQQEITLRRIE